MHDSRSDGHLYKAMLPSLLSALRSRLGSDPLLLREDDFFLIKREKILLIGEVVERGAGHLVVAIKGGELQEQTECHQHESAAIERLTRCSSTHILCPIGNLRLPYFYEDLKFTLTGNIESTDFKQGNGDLILELKHLFRHALPLCLLNMADDVRLASLGLYRKQADNQNAEWLRFLALQERYSLAL